MADRSTPYCKAPWLSLSLGPAGSVGPCCIIPQGLGELAEGQTLESSWESAELKSFRQAMFTNDLPRGCRDCQRKDQMGIRSVKTQYDSLAEEQRGVLTHNYSTAGSYYDFLHLDLSLTNKCNLKCRFCYSGNSTSWFKDRDKMLPLNPELYGLFLGTHSRVVDIDVNKILPFIFKTPNLRQIEFKGGEPFMANGHIPFLKALVENNHASKLALLYTSNATLLNDEVLELWSQFRHISFAVSVDGLGDVYKYVRGGQYGFEDDVLPNIKKIQNLGLTNTKISFHYTICAYNLLELGRFLEWFESSGINAEVSLGTVETPPYLSPRILSAELIKEACRRLESFKTSQVENLITGLKKSQTMVPPPERRTQFYNYTRSLDEIRKQSIEVYIPELAPFMRSLERHP